MGKFDKKGSTNMMAPHPGDLYPVEDLAVVKGMKPSLLAALCRAKGWAAGKQVTEAEFDAAAAALETRPMGGGKI
jgi:hypothetical protein